MAFPYDPYNNSKINYHKDTDVDWVTHSMPRATQNIFTKRQFPQQRLDSGVYPAAFVDKKFLRHRDPL